MRDYTKIEACKLADDLAVEIYRMTREFPREEIYGLTSQMRRAAVSVPANIAEGSARESKKDYLHFLYIARASLTETQYLLHLAGRLDYISSSEVSDRIGQQSRRTYGCLYGLIQAVEREVGPVGRVVATATGLLTVFLTRLLHA
jgi:four helix bundle protein